MLLGARQFFERRGAPTPPLPYDAEVEYLESTGTEYIDTGIELTGNMIVDARCSVPSATTPSYCPFQVVQGLGRYYGVAAANMFIIYLDTGRSSYSFTNDRLPHTLKFDLTGMQTAYLDGTEVAVRGRAFTAVAGRPIRLFARTISGSTQTGSAGRIMSFSVTDSTTGQKIQDLFPVRKDGVGYMYDKVSKNLLGNDGTGAFLYGPDIAAWTNPYVTDGLIAMWDGEWNAGGGVHDANATVWKDLVGTQDMSLSQYGSFSDDSLVCAGTGYAASRGTVFDDFIYAEAVVEYDSLEGQNGNLVIWGEYSGMSHYSNSMDLIIYADTLIQTGGSNVFYTKNANDKLFLIQYTRPNSSDVFAHANGVNLTRYSKTANWATRYGIGSFGGRQSGYSYRGKIKRVAMYSRIPTAAEIAANYAIDKARFNLP